MNYENVIYIHVNVLINRIWIRNKKNLLIL